MSQRRKLLIPSVVALAAVIALAASITYAFPSSPSNAQTFPLRQTVSNSDWNFTASINATSVHLGQSILLTTELRNTSPSNQTISPFVQPIINPGVYASNGTQVWGWNPPQATWPGFNVTSGQGLPANIVIPTSQLSAGQTYTIKVVPISTQFLTPTSFSLSIQFTVQH